MKTKKLSIAAFSVIVVLHLCNFSYAQNISINTTGAANGSNSMLEVLGVGTAANASGLYVSQNAAVTNAIYGFKLFNTSTSGTASINKYGLDIQSTGVWNGASSNNYGLQVNATGGTNNYAIVVPSGGGYVGIGTTAPDNPLHILSGGVDNFLHVQNSTNYTGLWLDGGQAGDGNGWLMLHGWPNQGDLTFREYGVQTSMTIKKTTGNVGIGTTDPQSKLSINTSTTSPGSMLEINNRGDLGVGSWSGIRFGLDANSYPNQYAKGGIIYESRDGYNRGKIHFAVNNVANSANVALSDAILTVDGTTGNVGIGTTTPTQALQIGDLTPTSTATPKAIDLGGTYSNTAATNLKLRLYDDATNMGGFGISANQMDYKVWANTADHVFYQGTTELMRVKGNGNVGIGTNPGAKLEVAGQVKITGGSPAANKILTSDAAGLASWSTLSSIGGVSSSCGTANWVPKMSSSTAMVCSKIFDDGTYVGIGTGTPGNGLQVVGPTVNGIWAGYFDGSAASTSAGSQKGLRVNAGANTLLSVEENSSSALTVNNQGSGDRLTVITADNGNFTAKFTNAPAGSGRVLKLVSGSVSANLPILQIDNNSTTVMGVYADGNMGINNTTPKTKLHINPNASFGGRANGIQLDDDYSFYIYPDPSTNSLVFDANGDCDYRQGLGTNTGNGKIRFMVGRGTAIGGTGVSTEAMKIDYNGNVGIGATTPAAGLQITSQNWMPETGTNAGGLGFGVQNNTGAGLGLSPRISFDNGLGPATTYSNQWNIDNFGGSFRIFSAYANAFFISANGKIGIGNFGGFPPVSAYLLQLIADDAGKPLTNTWTISSDIRLKKDISPFTDGLEVVMNINPVRYHYNGLANLPTDKEGIGIIAQEIQKVAPYTVGTYKTKLNQEDASETELLNFNSHALTFVTINAIKELNKQNQELKKTVEAQQTEISNLKSEYDNRLKALEEILTTSSQK